MKRTILTHPNSQLRTPAQLVDVARFGTPELKAFANELADLMVQGDGVGLAATQIGATNRIIVVAMPNQPHGLCESQIVSRSRLLFDFEAASRCPASTAW